MDRARRGLPFGFLLGVLTSVPVIVLVYAVHRATGLPLVPFDLFDAAARVLPAGSGLSARRRARSPINPLNGASTW
jgi:hypothetical protein